MKKMPIDLPPLEEQTEIVRRVEQLFTYADQIEQRVKDAQTRVNHLTQSILAKAFRGELTADWRAQNPELITGENSAAALLERIKVERATVTVAPRTKMRPRNPVAIYEASTISRKNTMKSRRDQDVWHKGYLANIIQSNGDGISAEALFKYAQLPIAEFYKQLSWEMGSGLLRSDEEKIYLEQGNALR